MTNQRLKLAAILVSGALLTSCVTMKKFKEEQAKRTGCESELSALQLKDQELEVDNTELKAKLDALAEKTSWLIKDTARIGIDLRTAAKQILALNESHEELSKKYAKTLETSQNESKKMSTELSVTKETLLKKQDELRLLEDSLAEKKQYLESLKSTLMDREQKIAEMQDILKKKDDATNKLRKTVADALLGFENKGLTVTQKNGNVYVSLEESLLFASGKTEVEQKGVEALKKLAEVLEQNQDINVMVEGHTDNVPMKPNSEIKDNWDLSALRATSIIKILTAGTKINPKRLTAAGRGEYFPIDHGKTPEARKKNRRTEIILTPKLDELLKILETN